MLRVTDVESGYGDLTILRGISFELAPGEVLAVLGHNGVGKSTLLRTLIGQLRARRGENRQKPGRPQALSHRQPRHQLYSTGSGTISGSLRGEKPACGIRQPQRLRYCL
jgi:ABC-type branched-subunit amino acid transport system ATPase component